MAAVKAALRDEHLKTTRWFIVLTLSGVAEGRRLGIKSIEDLRLLGRIFVVPPHELPPNFRRSSLVMDRLRSHDNDCATPRGRGTSDRKKTSQKAVGGDLRRDSGVVVVAKSLTATL